MTSVSVRGREIGEISVRICASLALLIGVHCALSGWCVAATQATGDSVVVFVAVDSGWNLLSLPVGLADGRRTTLFPSAVSHAYEYDRGYVDADTLRGGHGYWLKFAHAETISVAGELIAAETLAVRAGWNLVGAPTFPVSAIAVISEPPGVTESEFFGFRAGAGYLRAETIQPGRAYWVKMAGAGQLIADFDGGSCLETVWYYGKAYNTVKIGSQCWMKGNLDVGTFLPSTVPASDDFEIEKYCYDDDTANCALYGGLYRWDESMMYGFSEAAPGICPPGYHVPTYAEFQTLYETVWHDGNALKSLGQGSGPGAGTNGSGFSALLGGMYSAGYGFVSLGAVGSFWSSTMIDGTRTRQLRLIAGAYTIGIDAVTERSNFLCVRCIRD